jgi:molybdopterin-containing oxidoreductase family iron-sulfur binding subunit
VRLLARGPTGTEAIVALAMAHVILEKGWEDRAFLEKSTDWAEGGADGEHAVLALLRAISAEVASEMTGVPRRAIEDAAGLFARHRPGVALAGPGTPANPSGGLLPWAANLLNVLIGSVGIRGGIVEREKPPVAIAAARGHEGGRAPAAGAAITDATQLAQALLTSAPAPIDLLFVRDANPVFDSPLAQAFHRGLRQGDRMVVAFATELDETAQLADVVFPEPTFLERWDILTGTPMVPLGHATLQQPVIDPLFSARQSEEVLARVGHALEGVITSSFQATRAEELVQQASRGLFADARGGLREPERSATFREFQAAFQKSIVWAFSPRPGSSSRLARRISILPRPFFDAGGGAAGLYDLVRPRSAGDPDSYPYELVVFRTPQLRDGRTANLPMMMELAGHWAAAMWVTWVEIHPRTAASSGVGDGDRVAVVSEFGHILGVVRVSAATPPAVVAIPLGLGHEIGSTAAGVGANPNLIVASHLDDPAPVGLERVTRVKLVRV